MSFTTEQIAELLPEINVIEDGALRDKVARSIESINFHHADFIDFDIATFPGKKAGKK